MGPACTWPCSPPAPAGTSRDLIRAASSLGHTATPVDFRRLTARVSASAAPLAGFDAVLVRTMPPGSLEQVVFRMDLLATRGGRGVPRPQPAARLETCVDKYLTTAPARRGRPAACRRRSCASTPTPPWKRSTTLGGDVVVKPLFGSEGRGMVRVSDPELAWRTFRTLERTSAVLYLQQFDPPSRLGSARLRAGRRGAGRRCGGTRAATTGAPTSPRAASANVCGSTRTQEAPGPAGGGRPGRPSGRRRSAAGAGGASGTCWKSTPCPAGAPWPPVTGVDVAAAMIRHLAGKVRAMNRSLPHARSARANGLHLGGDGAQAGQRPSLSRLRRYAIYRLPDQRRRHRSGAGGAPEGEARRDGAGSGPAHASGDERTIRTSASSCCWRRWRRRMGGGFPRRVRGSWGN